MASQTASSDTFELSCPECEFTYSADSYEEAAEYSRGHRTHTGHDCCWELPPEFESRGRKIRHCLVWCAECGTETRFYGQKDAESFAADHERFTDHGLPEVVQIPWDGADLLSVSDLVSKLRMQGIEDAVGVPESVVFASSIRRGNSPRQADRKIDEALASGAVYYSSEFDLATTSEAESGSEPSIEYEAGEKSEGIGRIEHLREEFVHTDDPERRAEIVEELEDLLQ